MDVGAINNVADPFGLSPVWDAIMDVFAHFEKVCENHRLRYYAAFGTALGAVRHKGFIPWDDDFDVAMPREDFDAFVQIADQELPGYLKLITWQNTLDYPHVFAKVAVARKEIIDSVEAKVGCLLNQGIFIDVFPLDGFPSSYISGKVWWVKYLFYRCVEWGIQKRKPKSLIHCVERILGFVACALMPWVRSQRDIMPYLERLTRQVPYKDSRYCGYILDHCFFRPHIHKTKIFECGKRVGFYKGDIVVASDCDAYLRIEYGDYMELPPIGKQQPSHRNQYVAPWKYGSTNQVKQKTHNEDIS